MTLTQLCVFFYYGYFICMSIYRLQYNTIIQLVVIEDEKSK